MPRAASTRRPERILEQARSDVRQPGGARPQQDRPARPREKLLALAADANETARSTRTFMISALTGDGLRRSARTSSPKRLPEGPWLYPEDQISDLPMRQLAAEITREKLFLRLHQELPYASPSRPRSWKEQKDGSVRIEQVDLCRARQPARRSCSARAAQTHQGDRPGGAQGDWPRSLERPVHLFLFVKVREQLGRRSGTLPRDGARIPRMSRASDSCGSHVDCGMDWRDDGIILGTRRHGETSAIVELMTAAHGRHLGLVRGGRSRRMQPMLQPGNRVDAIWRARLDEHLGNYLGAGRLSRRPADGDALASTGCSLRCAPAPFARARSASRPLQRLRSSSRTLGPLAAGELVARLEVMMLEELGFGLDLSPARRRGDRRSGLCLAADGPGRDAAAGAP